MTKWAVENMSLPDNFLSELLDQNQTKAKNKTETEYWDYKEDFDFSNNIDVAKLAKKVLAFHNSKGGILVYGINDEFSVVGYPKAKIPDITKLNNAIKYYCGPSIHVQHSVLDIQNGKKVLWIIIIPKNEGAPVPVKKDGPIIKDNRRVISRNDFYRRDNDETKVCKEPYDLEKLFTGRSFKSYNAYFYEFDEPFFRLLEPHHKTLYGREILIDEIIDSIYFGREYIIELDGVGGVGKSALAIEVIRRLHKRKEFQFIVSISAKNKVWTTKSESRQAQFSGLTELLEVIAEVLQIPQANQTTEQLRNEVVTFMHDLKGLIFIDNLEEIIDSEVIKFLNKIPDPVKVIVTSRISKGLNAFTISVPHLNEQDAIKLLREELERYEYFGHKDDSVFEKEILHALGYLPLAIKWSANFIKSLKTLKAVSSEIRKLSHDKKELLNFCFSTMFENLSETAKNVSLLCPYLKEAWNSSTISIALKISSSEVDDAIIELEKSGIIMENGYRNSSSFSVLPITMNYLYHLWSENQHLKENATSNLAEAFLFEDKNVLTLPHELQIEILIRKVSHLEKKNENNEAIKLLDYLVSIIKKEEIEESLKSLVGFKYALIINKVGNFSSGIPMLIAVIENSDLSKVSIDDLQFAGIILLKYGSLTQRNIGIKLIHDNIHKSSSLTKELIELYGKHIFSTKDTDKITKFLKSIKTPYEAYYVSFLIIPDTQQYLIIPNARLINKLLLNALTYQNLDPKEETEINTKVSQLRQWNV